MIQPVKFVDGMLNSLEVALKIKNTEEERCKSFYLCNVQSIR